MTDYTIPCSGSEQLDIQPVFCGYEDCRGGHSYGPAVRDCYLIHYVHGGRGVFCCNGRYEIEKGQCFLICPGDVTFYKADEQNPWQYAWVAFRGDSAGRLLKGAGLSSAQPVLRSAAAAKLFEALYRKLKNRELPQERAEIPLAAFIFSLFSCLPYSEETQETQTERYVKKAKEYLGSMYAGKINVGQLARYCGLDRRYLGRIFKAQTGQTPQEHLIALRMSRAKSLLASSGLSVGDISRSVGYTDVYNFSKMFKKETGVSPLAYRRQGE